METPAATFVYRHTRLGILTERAADVVDLTDGLDSLLADAAVRTGIVNVRSLGDGTDILIAGSSGPRPPDRTSTTAEACVPVVEGRLQLGAGERVFLIDFTGPGAREIAVVMVGEARP